jgi:Tol biopolymer transport system component/predicted Ser/Thr protein kinase
MKMTPGTKLGPYEIQTPIGKGGMGEVYRARDTKLKREVALKVLPEVFARDPGRMIRFQREAEVLASLNHPNIAHIYGVEECALAMELVEGETLAGPLPIETALNYAKQIAEALEYAHERGVIHRDLKPVNVKITPEGVVKLLDFGLAKATEEPTAPVDASNSPTLTLGATSVGVILGTAAYMSPEQASGKAADRRSDIWSFGAVLYEMLSGKSAFAGESVSDTLASVLKVDPDWTALPQDTPAAIHKLLRRCLTKDRKHRLQAIGEARIVIEEQVANPQSQAEVPVQVGASASKLPWILAVAGIAAAVIVSFLYFRAQSKAERTQRYTIALPEKTTNIHSFAVSPDGRYVAIAAIVNGKRQLWLRALDALQAQPMPDSDDAAFPFWSPDSQHIGFFAQDKLKKIAASGGPAQVLCSVVDGRGGSWSRDDVIVFGGRGGNAIQWVAARGGVPTDVTRPIGLSRFPVFLPDGRHFLYLISSLSRGEESGVYLSSLDGKEERRVLAERSNVVFGGGHLLFTRGSTLLAQSFDVTRGQTVGEAFPIAESVSSAASIGYAPISVSETGVLLYASSNVFGGNNQMVWYDRNGKLLETIGAPGPVEHPAIAPDEKSIVFRRTAGGRRADLWLRDLARKAEQRFTTDASGGFAPVWSPNGDHIAFAASRGGGNLDLYQKPANTTGQVELLVEDATLKFPTQWSRDGRFIVYSSDDPKATKLDIWVLPMDSGAAKGKPVPFLRSTFDELHGQLSPDSHWMAYTCDESGQPDGQPDVYVRPFPPAEGKWKVSIAGGEQPRWRGDGKEIFFVAADGKMMVAPVVKATFGPKPAFEAAAPQPLFETHLVQSFRSRNGMFEYDVTADGKRFLLNTVAGGTSAPLLNVVLNWDAGLKK